MNIYKKFYGMQMSHKGGYKRTVGEKYEDVFGQQLKREEEGDQY